MLVHSFDLETTSRAADDIVELATMVVGPDSVTIEAGTFQAFVKPRKQFHRMLTGISNEMAGTAQSGLWSYYEVQGAHHVKSLLVDASTSYILKVLVYTCK